MAQIRITDRPLDQDTYVTFRIKTEWWLRWDQQTEGELRQHTASFTDEQEAKRRFRQARESDSAATLRKHTHIHTTTKESVEL